MTSENATAVAGSDSGSPADDAAVGWRAARTRDAIVDAARRLFLDRGYGGTRINNITDACNISRAGFYTYFKDKRAVFNFLGEAAYHDLITVIEQWDTIARPASYDDIVRWVGTYFDFLDVHGAFILSSAQSAPTDADFRSGAARMQMRVGFLLGTALRTRQSRPTKAPETLGLAIVGLLERGWFHSRAQQLPLDDGDMISTMASIIDSTLTGGPA